MISVKSGLDILLESQSSKLNKMRIGLIANHSAVDYTGNHIVDRLSELSNLSIVRLFAPEHGFRGEAQDMESVGSTKDLKTGLEIVSLYGEKEDSLKPNPEHLKDLDAIVFDIQDVGARYYTYANTLAYTMQVAAKLNIKVFVLDRPNPIDGIHIEGSPLLNDFHSFCGYTPIPNRHGLTVGELAIVFKKGLAIGGGDVTGIDCDLEIIKMENWNREMIFDETALPWVFPSPNMPTLETALVYPGGCLFEATNISEGRGTTKPFELLGAPYIDAEAWRDKSIELYAQLTQKEPSDFFLRPTSFCPKFQKSADESCFGVQIHLINRKSKFSYKLCLAMIAAAKSLWPESFAWRKEAYEFKDELSPIDILYGSSSYRLQLESNPEDLTKIKKEIDEFEEKFLEKRTEFLLY